MPGVREAIAAETYPRRTEGERNDVQRVSTYRRIARQPWCRQRQVEEGNQNFLWKNSSVDVLTPVPVCMANWFPQLGHHGPVIPATRCPPGRQATGGCWCRLCKSPVTCTSIILWSVPVPTQGYTHILHNLTLYEIDLSFNFTYSTVIDARIVVFQCYYTYWAITRG